MSDSATIGQKLWNYCNVLRDDGLSYQDYIEQLTFLLFLKMADEQTKAPFSRPAIVPGGLDWASLVRLDGDDLEVQYPMPWTSAFSRGWVSSAFRGSRLPRGTVRDAGTGAVPGLA